MDELDRQILSAIQADLPVVARPFDALAERLGAKTDEVLGRIRRMIEAGPIRRLGPVFDSGRLGYSSTLVAAKVPPDRLTETAARVSALPGVTHNYERRGPYNLWFTLTARSEEEIVRTLADLRAATGLEFHRLPALAVYKIRAVFDVSAPGEPARHDVPRRSRGGLKKTSPAQLGADEQALVRALQDGLEATAEPFAPVAARVGRPVEWVLGQVRKWLSSGVVRRFGAVLRHTEVGFRANSMAAFALPPERTDEAGRTLAKRPEITHCYRRPPLPGFPYSLYVMIHGRSEDEVRALAARLAREIGARDHAVLFSATEFKKTSMRYFV